MNAAAERSETALMGFTIHDGQISAKKFSERSIAGPVAGARAEVVHGADSARFTATRIAAFGPIGLLMKKNTTSIFIIVTCTNGVEIVAEHNAKKMEAKARKWISKFNSKHHAP